MPSGVGGNVRFGSKADMCSAKGDVRFTPKSGHAPAQARTQESLLQMSATLVVVPAFRWHIRCDKVRVGIAPSAIACQHIRPTRFERRILAIPIHLCPSPTPRTMGPRKLRWQWTD